MLDGQRSDLDFHQFQSQDELLRYCDQVASSVGTLILELLEDPSPELAKSLGRSLQLLNIARDLREDFDRGRLYLPIEWIGTAQSEWSSQAPGFQKGLERTQELLQRELARSRELEHHLKKPLSRLFVGLIRKAYDPWWKRLVANPQSFLGTQKPLTVSERLRSLL
jgi:phytoene synthase